MRAMRSALFAAAIAACAAAQFARAEALAPFSRGSFESIRKAHAGRPLIVHFWSVTCAICVAELAEWGKLARETQGVDFVFVNADGESDRRRVETRMEKAGIRQAENFAFADRFVERLYFEVDRRWQGEMPFTALISADGGTKTVIGALDDMKLDRWLEAKGRR